MGILFGVPDSVPNFLFPWNLSTSFYPFLSIFFYYGLSFVRFEALLTVFLTNLVELIPDNDKILVFFHMVLFPSFKIDGVQNDMTMQVIPVNMDKYPCFMPFCYFFGNFYADL